MGFDFAVKFQISESQVIEQVLILFHGDNQLNISVVAEDIRGKVKWFNVSKGFGFLNCEKVKDDVMVHFSEVQVTIAGTRNLFEGQTVDFNLVYNPEKGYSAQNVRLIL